MFGCRIRRLECSEVNVAAPHPRSQVGLRSDAPTNKKVSRLGTSFTLPGGCGHPGIEFPRRSLSISGDRHNLSEVED